VVEIKRLVPAQGVGSGWKAAIRCDAKIKHPDRCPDRSGSYLGARV
jgi:hypothetical protein